jgi:hypothetical protein
MVSTNSEKKQKFREGLYPTELSSSTQNHNKIAGTRNQPIESEKKYVKNTIFFFYKNLKISISEPWKSYF